MHKEISIYDLQRTQAFRLPPSAVPPAITGRPIKRSGKNISNTNIIVLRSKLIARYSSLKK